VHLIDSCIDNVEEEEKETVTFKCATTQHYHTSIHMLAVLC